MLGLFRPAKPKLTRAQMLAARPLRMVEGTLTPTSNGGARLTVPLKPAGIAKVLLRSRDGLTKTFELDAVGLFVWHACDGTLSFEDLVRKVANHLKISHRESEVATGTFIQTLARKGLLGLEVPKP